MSGSAGSRADQPHAGGSDTATPDGGRAVPYACPFCAEEDLRPVEGGRWHCRSCLRVFAVQFFGVQAAARPPASAPGPGSVPLPAPTGTHEPGRTP